MAKNRPHDIPSFIVGDAFIPRTPEQGDEPKPWAETKIVGKRMPRVDAYERVSGSAQFTYDVFLPGMLYAAVLRCPHAHAIVKSVDTSTAENMPGVRAVITKDSPEAALPFNFRGDEPQSKLFDEHCRYDGEEVAAVAAETPHQAWDAISAIKVEYDVLPFVLDPREALQADAAKLYEEGNDYETIAYSRGDVESGFGDADSIVELDFTTRCFIHAPLEVHGTVAYWDGPKLILYESTQGVYSVAEEVGRTLRLPKNNLRVICKYVGGAFGSKLGAWKNATIASVLARRAAKPVKLMLTRGGSLTSVGNGPALDAHAKAGVKKDGTITAFQYLNHGNTGAYAYSGGSTFLFGETYTCANVDLKQPVAFTNVGKTAPLRAPGFPQCNWALEQTMDQLAREIGMDPVEFRLKNIPAFSQIDDRKRPYTSTGFAECLRRGAEEFGWKDQKPTHSDLPPHVKRGFGMAGGMWAFGGGWPPATVYVKMFVDGSVSIISGITDIGTGTKTILTMIVAEELGMPVERIGITTADTASTPFSYSSGGSKTLPTEGPAARMAAIDLRNKIFALAADEFEVDAADLELRNNEVILRSDPEKKINIPQLFNDTLHNDVTGIGYRGPNPAEKIVRTWGAHFAEVEVNTLTGKIKVVRFVAAHDSGKVINRLTYNNQIFGGMTQGLGQAMTEGRIMDAAQTGKMINKNWIDYKIPTSMELPIEHTTVAVDMNDQECTNIGAKGLGEPPVIMTGAAIGNAVFDAIGVRLMDQPMTPERVLEALNRKTVQA